MALLESALHEFARVKSETPEAVDYYRTTSVVSLVEYSVGPDDIPPTEKVCCNMCNSFKIILCYFYVVTACRPCMSGTFGADSVNMTSAALAVQHLQCSVNCTIS